MWHGTGSEYVLLHTKLVPGWADKTSDTGGTQCGALVSVKQVEQVQQNTIAAKI